MFYLFQLCKRFPPTGSGGLHFVSFLVYWDTEMSCSIQYKVQFWKTGIHILFFSESLTRQVSLMAYLPGYNLGCPDKSAEFGLKEGWKNWCATWTFLISIYFRYSYYKIVLTKLLSTTGYWARLNTVYLRLTSSYSRSVCHEGKMVHLACIFPRLRQRLLRHFFAKLPLKNVTS